ncbi:ABC transporter ATP-binding protein [Kineosporia sp. R_H_3]|uniref:ABC transporter ATP-binding protein n=1 Tax=Kineosporia sp. R_H_3 TaxID=1961848 RepID=UPI000B4ADDC2|nr:ABC transporter ATP-binding protein [Kineosporia sp. R_H_3]
MSALLEVRDLTVRLRVGGTDREVITGTTLEIGEGEAMGLVGESGSGKSMTAKAIARLLPAGARVEGSVRFAGTDVLGLSGADLRRHRAKVAVVFQDPRAHINPVRRIEDFMTESLRTLEDVPRAQARTRAADALEEVGIDDPARRLRQFPHELSGGMLQRVMIATALLSQPLLLLADECTTALDVTTQAEVMAILDDLRRDRGLSMLFITHDLELAGAVCDRTSVMYAGQVVETSAAHRLHADPLHPYSAALVQARPDVTSTAERLVAIPGRPVSAFEAPAGCRFAPRCPHVLDGCRGHEQTLVDLDAGRVRCERAAALRGRLLDPTESPTESEETADA